MAAADDDWTSAGRLHPLLPFYTSFHLLPQIPQQRTRRCRGGQFPHFLLGNFSAILWPASHFIKAAHCNGLDLAQDGWPLQMQKLQGEDDGNCFLFLVSAAPAFISFLTDSINQVFLNDKITMTQ
jgi:hypothetical protein